MIDFAIYVSCLLIVVVGIIYFLKYFLSKKEFHGALIILLLCFAIAYISYGFGVKSVDVRSELSYFQPTERLLKHFADLINDQKHFELDLKLKYIIDQIEDKHWRDNNSYKRVVEQTINKN